MQSGRNHPITRYSDRSPHPRNESHSFASADHPGEVWFPVVDVALDASFFAEVTFASEAPSTAHLNHHLWREAFPARGMQVFPGDRLLEWENLLFTEDKHAAVMAFTLGKRVPLLLSPGWSGRVSVEAVRAGVSTPIGSAEIRANPPVRRKRGNNGDSAG